MLRSGKKKNKKQKTGVKANSHRQSVCGPACADALATALLPVLRGLREWRLPKHLLGTGLPGPRGSSPGGPLRQGGLAQVGTRSKAYIMEAGVPAPRMGRGCCLLQGILRILPHMQLRGSFSLCWPISLLAQCEDSLDSPSPGRQAWRVSARLCPPVSGCWQGCAISRVLAWEEERL